MSTALQLINRLRRRQRWPDVAAFDSADIQTQTLLDLLNESIRDAMNVMGWHWQVKTDVVIGTVPTRTFTETAGVTNASTTVTFPSAGLGIVDVTGGWRRQIRVTNDGSFSNTAFPVKSISEAGGTFTAVLEVAFPGTTNATATLELMAYEGAFVDKTARVLSARHEEQPMHLVQSDVTSTEFDRYLTRPWETKGDPEVIRLGGTVTPTYQTSGTVSYAQQAQIWPIPESTSTIIHLTVARDSSDMTDPTDTIEDNAEVMFPLVVEDAIVSLTEGRVNLSAAGNDPEMGRRQTDDAMERLRAIRRNRRYAARKRRIVQPHDRTSGRATYGFGRLPRIIPGP